MKPPVFNDWQFGRLRWNESCKYYQTELEWILGLTIELWIYKNKDEFETIIERARTIFDSLQDRKDEYLFLAAQKLLDTFNEILKDDDNLGYNNSIGIQSFMDNMTMNLVEIYPNGWSQLTYINWGYPLVRVSVSDDLSFKDAFFD